MLPTYRLPHLLLWFPEECCLFQEIQDVGSSIRKSGILGGRTREPERTKAAGRFGEQTHRQRRENVLGFGSERFRHPWCQRDLGAGRRWGGVFEKHHRG